MRKMMKLAFFSILLFHFTLVPAFADWKTKIVNNQIKVMNYISQLQKGADPNNITRPTLRHDKKYKASLANKELREAMDEAEALARAGKHDQIKDPVFGTQLVSEERFKHLQQQYEQGKK